MGERYVMMMMMMCLCMQVGYEDGGRLRPILHRASLVEMIVPYGDPNYPYVRKSALDVGDYGMVRVVGWSQMSL